MFLWIVIALNSLLTKSAEHSPRTKALFAGAISRNFTTPKELIEDIVVNLVRKTEIEMIFEMIAPARRQHVFGYPSYNRLRSECKFESGDCTANMKQRLKHVISIDDDGDRMEINILLSEKGLRNGDINLKAIRDLPHFMMIDLRWNPELTLLDLRPLKPLNDSHGNLELHIDASLRLLNWSWLGKENIIKWGIKN